jgi:MFS family permease
MIERILKTYHKYPIRFWALLLVVFIDMIGGTLLSPFFALYITQKFGVGMTQAGIMLGMFAFFGLFGNAIGGALTDRFGRKKIILFGLIFSALSTITLGFVNTYWVLFPLSALIGILGSISGPAHNAMVADMLPAEQHNEGYGMVRVVANLSWIIGPSIGGFVASRSYLALFLLDAVFSLTTAVLVFKIIPETMPVKLEKSQHEPFLQTIRGYKVVFQNYLFIAFLGVSMLMLLVYQQMYNTLSVYLRDVHQIPTTQYGYMLSASAILVVLTQFWISTQTKKYPPMATMAFGCAFYMIGFSMFGFTSHFIWFILAILIITVGEMITFPVSQALAAKLSPEDMRGRYMAVFSISWAVPSSVGPGLAGMILDNADPRWVWYTGGIICAFAIFGYLSLHRRISNRPEFQINLVDE